MIDCIACFFDRANPLSTVWNLSVQGFIKLIEI